MPVTGFFDARNYNRGALDMVVYKTSAEGNIFSARKCRG